MIILKAINSIGISRCARIELSEHLKTCIQLSGSTPPTIPEFQFLIEFVAKNFGNYKLKELGAAFELYALGKLDVERNFGTFSPKFFGDVMSAYKPIAVQLRNKLKPIEYKPMEYKINEEEVIKETIEYWANSKKDWRFLNWMVFDYLWKRKLIKLDKEKGDQIKARVRAVMLAKAKKPEDMLISDELLTQLCKKYTLGLYLNNEL